MVYSIDNINYVITGKNQKMVNLTITQLPEFSLSDDIPLAGDVVRGKTFYKTFVTDEGLDSMRLFNQEYNTHRLKILHPEYTLSNENYTIYSLFDMKDVAIKSRILKHVIEDEKENVNKIRYSKDLTDRFNSHLSSDPMEFCQLGTVGVGLALEDRKFPASKKTNLIDTRYDRLVNGQNSLEWHFKISSDENSTFTYVALSDLVRNHRIDDPISSYLDPEGYYFVAKSCSSLSSNVMNYFFGDELIGLNLSSITLNETISNLFDHSVVEPNQIFEVLVDEGTKDKVLYNDFNNGIVRGSTYLGKNDFDAEYSMNMKSKEKLEHARNYIGLGNVGNRLFLKYYDETDYEVDTTVEQENSENGIKKLISKKISPTENSYQNVEIFDAVTSFMGNYSRHKANLYAITIKNAGLSPEASPSLSAKMDVIRAQVANTVRTIAENLAPAHTQLLQVNFQDTRSEIAENDMP